MGILGSALAAQKKKTKKKKRHSITTHFNWHLVVNVKIIYTHPRLSVYIYTWYVSWNYFPFLFYFLLHKIPFFFLKFYLKNFTWLKCLKKKNWNSPALIFVNRQFMTVFPPPSCILFFQKKIPSDWNVSNIKSGEKGRQKGRRKSL